MAARRSEAKPPRPDALDVRAFLESIGIARRVVRFARGTVVFRQGGPATSVFYIQDGCVKLSVVSSAGREAVIAMLGAGDFFGEGCLAGQPLRMGTATAVVPTKVLRIQKREMIRTLHQELSDRFLAHMLVRNIRIEERPRRSAVQLEARSGSRPHVAAPRPLQRRHDAARHPQFVAETLAEMVRTTGRA